MPAKFGFRINRFSKKRTPVKGHVNIAGKENIPMHENGHRLRDLLAHTLKLLKKQGKTNQELRHYLSQQRSQKEIINLVTTDPHKHVQKKLVKEYNLKNKN
ncbi:MAG: hypothetical protein WC915_06325 [archaeon]|jgi:hypothetical protein